MQDLKKSESNDKDLEKNISNLSGMLFDNG
jgi:hypothetical protein